jgi:SNF2 family DNA or RNA helicase
MIYFLEGDIQKANIAFKEFLDNNAIINKKSVINASFSSFVGYFYMISLLSQNDAQQYTLLQEFVKNTTERIQKRTLQNDTFHLVELAEAIKHFQVNNTQLGEQILEKQRTEHNQALDMCFYIMAVAYSKNELDIVTLKNIRAYMNDANRTEYRWLASQLMYIAQKAKLDNIPTNYLKENTEIYHIKNAIQLIEPDEEWKKILKSWNNFEEKNDKITAPPIARLCWGIDFEREKIQPYSQKINKNGSWSALKNVSIHTFKENGHEAATEQDMQIMRCFKAHNYYYREYIVEYSKALKLLTTHPSVFAGTDNPIAVSFTKREPVLIVEKSEKNGNFIIRFDVNAKPEIVKDPEKTIVVKESTTSYVLYEFTPEQRRIFEGFKNGALEIPEKGKDLLEKAMGSLIRIIPINTTTSAIAIDLPKIEADPSIHVLITPYESEGLRIEFIIKPFGNIPPHVRPGKTPALLIGEINKEKYQTLRDLAFEKESANKLMSLCPILKNVWDNDEENENHFRWEFADLEDSLEALYQLNDAKSQAPFEFEYPEGQKFKIGKKIGFEDITMRIEKNNNWFDVEVEMRINESQDAIRIAEIMSLLKTARGKFIQMSNGEFIALTDKLRKRLNEINTFSEKDKKGNYHIHNLASFALEDISQDFKNLNVDNAWKAQIKKIKNATKINPKVPSTLKTELRPYQEEGFKWLAQLAEWGVGACLADDMGLGKTIQTLALLLQRAEKGTALVIAPPTVARNWISETNKFAPTLNAILYGGKDRELILDQLKDHDVLVCSYGLLQQDGEALAKKKWTTIVLDEAQNIKNMNTKRSKSAMELDGDFKMITTGTPVENHLGELWNLFRFINPGLLGTLKDFQERFANEIERNQNKERQKHLQKLLKPFILRRKKNQVLDDLPSKTEITLQVEMSDDELAFYEALRMNIVEKLQNNIVQNQQIGEGEKRFQILAEILKLRQASCNPKLVMKNTDIKSSKLELLMETVEELKENGHKALIFSQFVGHLGLIREAFDEKKLSYKYLDGSTPMNQREQSIKAFQNGEADFFLISLKAGGVGLNLTAADYVIHMDPWWNPAVEDQASDRAHRMGQLRPVTIYRFVTKGSIEEKILMLHQDKRDLADGLLDGTEASAKISTDELLSLIKQG